MGDLLSPKRRDVFDRLRRRIEEYRRHNQANLGRFEGNLNGVYDQQHLDTVQLHQRWIESKAKRNQKKGNQGSQSKDLQEQRSHSLTQQKLKRKLDAQNANNTNNNPSTEASGYNFEEGVSSPPPNKTTKSDTREGQVHSSVSVNIVQQINTQSEHPGTSQIKLTVTSNLQTGLGPDAAPSAQTSTSVETKTNVCKSEPTDDSQCAGPSSSSSQDPIGIDDVDELQAILDTLEREEGEIPPDFIKDLDLLKEVVDTSNLNQDKDEDNLSNKNPMFSGTNTKRSPGPGMFAEPALYDNSSSSQGNSVGNNGMGAPSAAAVANYQRPATGGGAAAVPPQVPPTPPMLGDTGPAAETLKQMAAQHQNQNYGMKSNYQDFAEGYGRRGMMPPHGYSQYQGQYNMPNAAQNNMYYGPQAPNAAMGNVRPPYPHPGMNQGHPAMNVKQDPSISYGGTKPLSHYPEPMGGGAPGQSGPSSLQQLQNQVQSTFNHQGQNPGHPGPQGMQINQSQHMHMSHGSQRMQLSQTQQMQIHTGSNISVAQQQSFSMNPQGMHPQQHQYVNAEQMKMHQMYREQQQRQMQSYMNRPPPEYKVPPGGMPSGNYGVPNGMGNGNPMQNMQKMVNQTNHAIPSPASGQNGMYPAGGGNMKTEQPGGMPSGQGVPSQHSGSSGSPASLPRQPNTPTEGSAPNIGSYPNTPAQQHPQQMMQGQHMPRHSMPMSTQNRPAKPETPTYTSAILRGQRPPNVNVGPEGLNISQQRPHSADWRRQGIAQGPAGSPMPSGGMAYGYQGQTMGMQAGPGGPRMAMAQQHAMQQNAQTQQQRMAMMQQMHANQQPQQQQQGGTSMSMSQAMSTSSTPTSQQQQQPTTNSQAQQPYQSQQQQGAAPPNGNAEYIPLDFLDNQQSSNSDFFNSVVPDPNSTDIFDELFGK